MLKHLYLWFLAIVFSFLLLPLVQSKDDTLERITNEINNTTFLMGTVSSGQIVGQANALFDSAFVKTGVIDFSSYGKTSQAALEKQRITPIGGTVERFSLRVNDYIDSLIAQCYGLILRLVLMCQWLPYIAPFAFAVIVHGITLRNIKFDTGGIISPMVYSTALHMMVVIFFFPLLYLIIPLVLTPLFVPYWLILSAIPTIAVLSNIQRVSK
jgi:hypothetical protein